MQYADKLPHSLIFLGPATMAQTVCRENQGFATISMSEESRWRNMIFISFRPRCQNLTTEIAELKVAFDGF